MYELSTAQQAWEALLGTLPDSDARVGAAKAAAAAAQIAFANARTAERAARTTIVNRLAAWLDADPAADVRTLSAAYPIALLPVRLETRFYPPMAPTTLRVRIFPDSIHSDTHEPELTADEGQAGDTYWNTTAAGLDPAEAWRRLLLLFPPERAAYLVKATDPRGARPPSRASTWTRPAETHVLPDRWIIVAYRGGAQIARVVTQPVVAPLALTISPLFGTVGDAKALATDPDLAWAADFQAAVAAGMAAEIALSPTDAQAGFDRIIAVGVKASMDPAGSAGLLSDLWRDHAYTRGVAFMRQGSPTNNTVDAPAAYPPDDPNGTASIALQRQGQAPPQGSDGKAFLDALGLTADLGSNIAGATGIEQTAAYHMNTVVWSPTLGYYLRELLAPGFDGPIANPFSATVISAARTHFQNYVRGRGPLPAFRVGTTPYGVLPATSLKHWNGFGTTPDSAFDLVAVQVRPATTSNPDQVRIGRAFHSPASGLRTVSEASTPLPRNPAMCAFAVGGWDGGAQPDLYVIRQLGTTSGHAEYSVVAARSDYTSIVAQGVTPLGLSANYAFAVGNWDGDGKPDLFAINRQGATATEVTIFSGASGFQTTLLQAVTGLPKTDQNWQFALGDWDRDGRPDLLAVQTAGAASGHVEIHILSGASNFHTEILRVDTSIAVKTPVDVSVADWTGDGIPDVVLAYRNQAGADNLTVSVLRGDQGLKQALADLTADLPDADTVPGGVRSLNPTPAIVLAADWDGDGRAELLAVRNDGSSGTGGLGVQVLSATPLARFSEPADLPDPHRATRTTVASAVVSLTAGQTDLVLVQAAAQAASTDLSYRIARDLNGCGVPTHFAPDDALAAGPSRPASLISAGLAVADLDKDGNPELVLFCIDSATGATRGSYRIGWKLDATGKVDHWSADVSLPYATRQLRPPVHVGGSMTLADLDGSGSPDMLVLVAERAAIPPGQTPTLYYVVGKNLDATGQISGGWGNAITVPFAIGTGSTLGVAGIAVADTRGSGMLDVVIAYVDIAGANRTTWYRVGWTLDANGNPTGGWSDPYRMPDTGGAAIAGISLAKVSRAGWTGMLRNVLARYRHGSAFVPRMGMSADADADLLQALTVHPSSREVAIRCVLGPSTLINLYTYLGTAAFLKPAQADWATWYQRVQRRARDLLASLGDPAANAAKNSILWEPRMVDAVLETQPGIFNQPLVTAEPLSETGTLPIVNATANYLDWLAKAAPLPQKEGDVALDNATSKIDSPWPLLFYLGRHALLLEYAAAAFAFDVAQGGSAATDDQDPELVGIIPGARVRTVWDRLQMQVPASAGSTTKVPLWQFLSGQAAFAALITEVRRSLGYLSRLPTAELDRLVSETLDLCSHRVDSWVSSLATRRLQTEMRPANPSGSHVGGFGWLENVVPLARTRYTNQAVGGQSVLIPNFGGGYIHAPSAAMASAAAVLRNAYMSRSGTSTQYAIDLSSERARVAREVLDAIRQGVSLGAALGVRIERILDAAGLQKYIDPLRGLFPAIPLQEAPPAGTPPGPTGGRLVVDGLALRNDWSHFPWTLTTLPSFAADQSKLQQLLAGEVGAATRAAPSWTDPLDAVADLMTAELVYQSVRGNRAGTVASLDALSQGTRPPEPEILRQPRNGIATAHRVACVLGEPAPALPLWPDATPRGTVDPCLNSWIGAMLGDPTQVRCRASITQGKPAATTDLGEISLADLKLQPLDVLQLARTADSTGGASELDRRIAWKALQSALQRSLPMAPVVEQLAIKYSRQPAWSAAVRTFPDILELARAINAALGRSRPLQASDLLAPHEGALAQQAQPAVDATVRAKAAYDGFNAKVAALQDAVNAPTPDAGTLAGALLALAGFNLSAGVPQFVDAPNLLAQANDVLSVVGKRQTEAKSAINAMAAASGWSATDEARTAAQAIFGRDLPFLVGFTPLEFAAGRACAGHGCPGHAARQRRGCSGRGGAPLDERRSTGSSVAGSLEARSPFQRGPRIGGTNLDRGAAAVSIGRQMGGAAVRCSDTAKWTRLTCVGLCGYTDNRRCLRRSCPGRVVGDHSCGEHDHRTGVALRNATSAGAAVDPAGRAARLGRKLEFGCTAGDRQRNARSGACADDRRVLGGIAGSAVACCVAGNQHPGRFRLDRLPQPAACAIGAAMPPSITYWNRLEPHARVADIAESLAAAIRDPLWMLGRQWQLGEFAAADCGSPLHVHLEAQWGPLAGWSTDGAAGTPWNVPTPIEAVIESEPFTPDLATRAELGQWFEALLGANAAPQMLSDLRAAYSLPLVLDEGLDRLFAYSGSLDGLDAGTAPAALVAAFQAVAIALQSPSIWAVTPGMQWLISDPHSRLNYAVVKKAGAVSVYRYRDAEALRFLRLCAGRVADGVAVFAAAQGAAPILPARPVWTPPQVQALADAGKALVAAVGSVLGNVGTGDPAAWVPQHLAYELKVAATTAAGQVDLLTAAPGAHGEFDWTSFDLSTPKTTLTGVPAGAITSLSRTIVPGHVRFRGMPNARWWELETGATDFGSVQPEKRDVAKLIFMDFMLIHGNDWYLIPLDVPVGGVAQVNEMVVTDVFGVMTQIDRADTLAPVSGLAPGQQWTMFSPSYTGQAPKVGNYLVVPPSIWPTALYGPAMEEIRLLRDPVADLAWGVEIIVEGGVGQRWPGRERDQGAKTARGQPPGAGEDRTLHYRLHSSIPVNWIPFVAVAQGAGFALQRAVLPGDDAGTVLPAGRLLRVDGLREQEVSTQGTVVARVACRSRWIDGSNSALDRTPAWIRPRTGVERLALRYCAVELRGSFLDPLRVAAPPVLR